MALAVFAVMAGVGWPLLDTKVLVVRSVVVTGASPLVPAKRVRAVAAVRPGVPLTRVDTRAVASRVASITRVGTARVTRGWPDRIEISIRVRTPVLAVALPGPTASASTAGGFDLIDASGVVLRQVSRKPHGMPTLQAPGQPAGADFVATLHGSTAVAAAAAVLRALPARLASTVVTVTAQSADAVTLTLSDGATVVWGGPGRSAAKARELAVLLRGGAHYVDVSAPGTVVSR